MKLKTIGLLSIISTAFLTSNSNANLLFDIYAGATAGLGGVTVISENHHNSNTAQSYGAVLGLDIPLFRLEAEYDYLINNNADMQLGLINAYFKLPMALVQPYIGAGVGMILDVKANDTNIEKNNNATAYQAMLGATFDIPVLPFKIDAEGRALYTKDFYNAAGIQPDLLDYEVRLKLRYIF